MTTITETAMQVYQVFIKASPEQIWDAITKPEFTQKYLYGTRSQYDLRPGGKFISLAGDSEDVMVDGEVQESDPPRKLVHTWLVHYDPEMATEQASRVTWEIEPQDGGFAKLTVVHDQLEASPRTAATVAGGWSFVLSGLKTLLETGKPLT
jgi:uncharacterized protein YndB with AHSA1/START domain